MDAKKIEEVPFEEVYEVEKYGTYYSENKFWQKVQRVAKKVGATVIRPVFQLYYLLHDKDVPLQHKAYIRCFRLFYSAVRPDTGRSSSGDRLY